MATTTRRRMIWPEIWDDKGFAKLYYPSRLLFIGLISNADDYGRLPADEAFLKKTIFPYDKFTLSRIKWCKKEVKKHMKSVRFYRKNGQEYCQLLNWEKYQNVREDRRKLSFIPPPNGYQMVVGMTTEGQPDDGIGKVSIGKVSIEENNSSFKKPKRYFKGEEMRFSKNKWWVLPKDGSNWLEFTGSLKDTELK